MNFKMGRGGTARGDANLCLSCAYSQRRRYAERNDEVITCAVDEGRRVQGAVAECSSYKDASQPSLGDMRHIAWHVSTDKKRNFAGFLNPNEARKKESASDDDFIDAPLPLPGGGVEW